MDVFRCAGDRKEDCPQSSMMAAPPPRICCCRSAHWFGVRPCPCTVAPSRISPRGVPGDGHPALEDGHLLAMPAVGGATGHLVLGDGQLLGQGTLEPGAVQGGLGNHR